MTPHTARTWPLFALALLAAATARAEWPLIPSSAGARGLVSSDTSQRARGADLLAWEPRSDWVVALLVDRVRTEPDPYAMSAMYRALAIHGTPPARNAVLGAANDRRRRGATVAALGVLARSSHDDSARAAAASLLVSILLDAPNADVLAALAPDADATVAPLIAALARPAISSWAVRALGRLRDPRATPALVQALGTAEPSARVEIVEALGAIGDVRAAAALAARLTDADTSLALAAANALERCADAAISPLVVAAARDPRLRPAIFGVLARTPGAAARSVLEEAASSSSAFERRAALGALALRGDPASASALERIATASDDRTTTLAIAALGELRDAAGRASLERVARANGEHAEHAIRTLAVLAHRRGDGGSTVIELASRRGGLAGFTSAALAGDDDAARWLERQLMHRSDPAVRRMAATAVAAVARPGCDEPVAEAIAREQDVDTRRVLAVAAMRCGSRRARPWLSRLVADNDGAAPEAALALASAQVITEDARRALRMALLSEDPRVRASAALALGELRDARSSHHLQRMLRRDLDGRSRAAAARALGVVASARHSAALRTARHLDADDDVRREATDAWLVRTGLRAASIYAVGRTLLRARATDAAGRPLVDAVVDVTLPDGRRVRVASDPLGDVLVGGTVSGDAIIDVTPRVPPAPPEAPARVVAPPLDAGVADAGVGAPDSATPP